MKSAKKMGLKAFAGMTVLATAMLMTACNDDDNDNVQTDENNFVSETSYAFDAPKEASKVDVMTYTMPYSNGETHEATAMVILCRRAGITVGGGDEIFQLVQPAAMVDFGNQHRQVIARPVEGGNRVPQFVRHEAVDPVAYCRARHRSGDAVSLGDVTAQLQQDQAVFWRFDALGDDVAVEGTGQADDAFDDGQVLRIIEHVANEGLVDLEGIGR